MQNIKQILLQLNTSKLKFSLRKSLKAVYDSTL